MRLSRSRPREAALDGILELLTAAGIQIQELATAITLQSMGLIIRSSDIHAAGCYSTIPFEKDALIVEYTGPRITKDEGDVIYEESPVTYLFGLGDGETVIDGHGTAMFINHSCDPNCETEEIDGRVWIKAIRKIEPEEELTYDYLLYDSDEDAPCYCGAKKCRGTMYAPPEVETEAAKATRKRTKAATPRHRAEKL